MPSHRLIEMSHETQSDKIWPCPLGVSTIVILNYYSTVNAQRGREVWLMTMNM